MYVPPGLSRFIITGTCDPFCTADSVSRNASLYYISKPYLCIKQHVIFCIGYRILSRADSLCKFFAHPFGR